MSQSYIRIPPDGTGKRIATTIHLDINYEGLSGDIQVGDVVTGSVSGLLGEVIRLVPVDSGSGAVNVLLDHDAAEQVVNGEILTFVGVTPPGTASAVGTGTTLHTSRTQLMGSNNPFYGQHVDIQGAASVRFSEGAPWFDALGGQKVASPSTIGIYEFSSDGGFGLFATELVGAGTEVYTAQTSTVDMTVSSANGDSVIRTSNKCHYHWPGNGTTIVMSMGLNNSGAVGNTRRVGYFDTSDGLFFELKDMVMNVVLRSSVSGTVVDTRVPQSEWSHDRLDGTGLSGIVANWAETWVLWIDLQWFGAGRVRFGVLGPDGSRVVCHEFENSGLESFPYMKSGSLPVRAENFNTGVTGTSCQLRLTCLVVKSDGLLDYTYWRNAAVHDAVSVTGNNIPLISLRCALDYGGRRNPVNAYPEEYTCYNTDGVVRLDFCWPITLTGATWATAIGAMEVDTAATSAIVDADYWLFFSKFIGVGPYSFNLRDFFEANDEGIITAGNHTIGAAWNVVATKISGTPVVSGSLSWKELR